MSQQNRIDLAERLEHGIDETGERFPVDQVGGSRVHRMGAADGKIVGHRREAGFVASDEKKCRLGRGQPARGGLGDRRIGAVNRDVCHGICPSSGVPATRRQKDDEKAGSI